MKPHVVVSVDFREHESGLILPETSLICPGQKK